MQTTGPLPEAHRVRILAEEGRVGGDDGAPDQVLREGRRPGDRHRDGHVVQDVRRAGRLLPLDIDGEEAVASPGEDNRTV